MSDLTQNDDDTAKIIAMPGVQIKSHGGTDSTPLPPAPDAPTTTVLEDLQAEVAQLEMTTENGLTLASAVAVLRYEDQNPHTKHLGALSVGTRRLSCTIMDALAMFKFAGSSLIDDMKGD